MPHITASTAQLAPTRTVAPKRQNHIVLSSWLIASNFERRRHSASSPSNMTELESAHRPRQSLKPSPTGSQHHRRSTPIPDFWGRSLDAAARQSCWLNPRLEKRQAPSPFSARYESCHTAVCSLRNPPQIHRRCFAPKPSGLGCCRSTVAQPGVPGGGRTGRTTTPG